MTFAIIANHTTHYLYTQSPHGHTGFTLYKKEASRPSTELALDEKDRIASRHNKIYPLHFELLPLFFLGRSGFFLK